MSFKILATVLCLSLAVPAQAETARSGHLTPIVSDIGVNQVPKMPSPTAPNPQALSPEEQQALSQRAEEPGPQVVGGALTAQQLTYVVIALAAAVIVLIFK